MKKSVLISILVISAVITAGILSFIFIGYGTQGAINSSSNYVYTSSPTENDDISISADICDINIEYNNTPIDYGMKAYFTARIEGLFIKGRTFEEFFQYPQTQNLSSTKAITLSTHEDLFKNPLNFFSHKEIKLNIVLSTDVNYNFDIDVAVGDISIDVPEGVSVGNLDLATDVGDIETTFQGNNIIGELSLNSKVGDAYVSGIESQFNQDIDLSTTTGKVNLCLNNSDIDGNIATSTTTGSTHVSLINLTYMSDSNLNLYATTGSIQLIIDQRAFMDSNVSGSIVVTTGNIDLEYYDDQTDVSIRCRSTTTTGKADQYTSPGYPTTYNYNLFLEATTGNIGITATEN